MATRSRIGIEGKNGITSIYCHWDGYPEHNGKILVEHYADEAKIEQLMKLGNLSSLGAEIGTKHDFDQRVEGECTFYGRDRGEKNITARKHIDVEAFLDYREDFNYLFRNGKWECFDYDKQPVDLYKQLDAA